jgi:hypothetical protein
MTASRACCGMALTLKKLGILGKAGPTSSPAVFVSLDLHPLSLTPRAFSDENPFSPPIIGLIRLRPHPRTGKNITPCPTDPSSLLCLPHPHPPLPRSQLRIICRHPPGQDLAREPGRAHPRRLLPKPEPGIRSKDQGESSIWSTRLPSGAQPQTSYHP